MTPKTNATNHLHPYPLSSCILTGAGIALVLILVFLLGAGEPDPAWPALWIIKPLIIVPAAGAIGGGIFFIMDHLCIQGGWKKIAANALSLLFYLITLWMGTVLGLDGTWWN